MTWTKALPRPYYSTYEKAAVEDDWFDVYRLPHEVYAITEPRHFQEVTSFLILGSQSALLFDTGMGIGNIKKVVTALHPGNVVVINSHFHFDHIADNHRFDRVFLFNEPHAVSQLQKGCTPAELAYNVQPAMFWGNPPNGFDPAAYAIPPVTPQVVEDGHLFDLGNRTLQVIHTPGHTRDCIMLLDTGNRILFTGDSLYKGALYLHFQSPMYGYSDLAAYTNSMKKAARLAASLKFLYCSHNDPVVNPSMLHALVQALEQIQSPDSLDGRADAGLHAYEEAEDHLVRYPFSDFSIIVPAAK